MENQNEQKPEITYDTKDNRDASINNFQLFINFIF